MLIALPNIDGSFTCTLFLAYDKSLGGDNSFEHIDSEQKLHAFFDKQFPDVLEHMPHLDEEFFNNPTGNLVTIKCYPWSFDGKVCLLGDSCHAMVPFFGQGMNAAFEDCTFLNEYISNRGTDWEKIFKEFQKKRKPDTDAISELARENFIEMRDLVARPIFQLKKKIEAELQKRYPGKFIPKYSMVTFHRIPYSEALRRGRIQDEILNKLSTGISMAEETDWALAEKLVNDL
jgi:kynurenine 3-monooxygenase